MHITFTYLKENSKNVHCIIFEVNYKFSSPNFATRLSAIAETKLQVVGQQPHVKVPALIPKITLPKTVLSCSEIMSADYTFLIELKSSQIVVFN